MAVWSYVPQDVLTFTHTSLARLVTVSPQTVIAGTLQTSAFIGARLQYSLVDSQTVNSMTAFVTARRGAYEAFDWFYEGNTLRVRFDPDISIDWFHPSFLRVNGLVFTGVSS